MAATPRRHDDSPLRAALDRIGDRWILLVVEALVDGPQRFGDMQERVGAAPNILTNRLRRLEVEGLVVATPYSERPLRMQYELTTTGRELADALVALSGWGAATEGRPSEHFHQACGTALEVRPWCPTCERVVHQDEALSTYHL